MALAAARPLLPHGTARARRGAPAALLALLFFGAGYFGADGLLTIFVTGADHAGLYEAGAALTGGGVGWGITSLLAPRLLGRDQSKAARLACAGLALTAAGTLVLGATGPTAGLAAWVIASGGVGLAYPTLCLAATTATTLPPAELAASAIIAESFGALIGRSIGSGLASSITATGLSHALALRFTYVLFAGILALAAIVTTRIGPPIAVTSKYTENLD